MAPAVLLLQARLRQRIDVEAVASASALLIMLVLARMAGFVQVHRQGMTRERALRRAGGSLSPQPTWTGSTRRPSMPCSTSPGTTRTSAWRSLSGREVVLLSPIRSQDQLSGLILMTGQSTSHSSAIAEGPEDSAVVQTIVGLGRTLHLQTVAEGVEAGNQSNQLRELGYHYGQGYYYSKPAEAQDIDELLGRQERRPAEAPAEPN
jgi:hypothetical protein